MLTRTKPLARKRTRPRLGKLTPLQKKKLYPERYCAEPEHPNCTKTPLRLGRCGTHADEYLLRLRADRLRKPECELARFHEMTNTTCNGVLMDNHGISRGYTRGNLRWTGPGFWGCGGANRTAYFRGEEWREFLRETWGKEEYDRLVHISLYGPKEDYEKAERDLLAGGKDASTG